MKFTININVSILVENGDMKRLFIINKFIIIKLILIVLNKKQQYHLFIGLHP